MKKILVVEAILVALLILTRPIANALNVKLAPNIEFNTLVSKWLNKQTTASSICNQLNKEEILKEIQDTKDKFFVFNKTIGYRKIMYWEHKIHNIIYVKNDSILVHIDIEKRDIVYFKKSWTDVKINFSSIKYDNFEPDNCHWTKLVIFPDHEDLTYFYRFIVSPQFPVICWEVRYLNGSTILYDLDKQKIGCGVTAPSSQSIILRGYGDPQWEAWRGNAIEWYRQWCNSIQSKNSPETEWISSVIKNQNVELFYVIAHSGGESTQFQANASGVYYTGDQLSEDMKDRLPIKLAILCCCEAMRDTNNPGTLSYEFRKGQLSNTVTIGYVGMSGCPGWSDSLYWQDSMFKKINRGFTIKRAFDLACAEFPRISDCVKFVGDVNLKISDNPHNKINEFKTMPKYLNFLQDFSRFSRLVQNLRPHQFRLLQHSSAN